MEAGFEGFRPRRGDRFASVGRALRKVLNAAAVRDQARLKTLPVFLLIGFSVLVAIAGVAIWLVDASERDAARVSHTLEVQGKLHELLRYLRHAESGERGYVLSGHVEDFEIYRAGVERTEAALAEIRRLSSENPGQQTALNALEPIVRSGLADLASVIAAGRAEGNQLIRVIERGRGQMADIADRIDAMLRTEQQLLSARQTHFRTTSHQLLAVTILGALLIVVLAAVSVLQVRRSTRALAAARQATELVNAGLERAVAQRTAELRDSNEEIQRYAYIVSHDLRAPLVNVMGFTSELEALKLEILAAGAKQADDPARLAVEREFDESIAFIKTATAKMDKLIGAVLKISREGRRIFQPEPLDMDRLVQAIADAQRHQAEAGGATVKIGPLPRITADRLAVEQVFANLLDNSIKYLNPNRPGLIEVTGVELDGRVRFDVRDNGRGIYPQDHNRIFELFRRSGAQDRPGEGIGLAHVKSLVRSLSGRIEVISSPEAGATFSVTLPKAPQVALLA